MDIDSSVKRRPRVAILGGGMAALAAAFKLTSDPDWKSRISQVVVYQPGWRLGGKGASGRNHQRADRIEEHGLHVWPGFYDRAFRLVRQCYEELGRPEDHPLSDWHQAFVPQNFIVVSEYVGGQWKPWPFAAPGNDQTPGDLAETTSLWHVIVTAIQRVGRLSAQLRELDDSAHTAESERRWDWAHQWLEHAGEFMTDFARATQLDAGLDDLFTSIVAVFDETRQALLAYAALLPSTDDRVRRLWIQLDFTLAALRGALADRVPLLGFDHLDDMDFRQWLRGHGASDTTLRSALLTGLYDFVFASINADPDRQSLAAGAALRLVTRLVSDYKGAIMWKMRASLGDVVFAPLYEVLRRRGVQFHFFHRVRRVVPDRHGRRIDEIHLDIQATPVQPYDPLVDVQGLPCWPNRPRYELLEEGEELQRRGIDLESDWTDWEPVGALRLRHGEDFDAVVLGISLGALPHACSELIRADVHWQRLVQNVKTVQTCASQLWFHAPLAQLGWKDESPLLTGFQEPLETWGDFSPTIEFESWPADHRPRNVAYLCGTLADAETIPAPGPSPFPEEQQRRARELARQWFVNHAPHLWPGILAPASGQVRWDLLVDPSGNTGEARLAAQWHRASVNSSDRYVQSIAGSTVFRLSPRRAWFGNLFVCGDWTRSDLNVGCLEGAVSSGQMAAKTLREHWEAGN